MAALEKLERCFGGVLAVASELAHELAPPLVCNKICHDLGDAHHGRRHEVAAGKERSASWLRAAAAAAGSCRAPTAAGEPRAHAAAAAPAHSTVFHIIWGSECMHGSYRSFLVAFQSFHRCNVGPR